jgi:hypothetical protein
MPSSRQQDDRYEQSVRVVTAFFAAVIGFGLKNLLDATEGGQISAHKWPFFLVTIFLFLRYLLGSANHLWAEYVSGTSEVREWPNVRIVKDFAFLVVFGVLAATMCYAPSALQFYRQGIYLVLVALAWVGIDWIFHRLVLKTNTRWNFWLLLNGIQLIFFVIAWYLAYIRFGNPPWTTWSWSLILLVSSTASILLIDLLLQLRQFDQGNEKSQSSGPESLP